MHLLHTLSLLAPKFHAVLHHKHHARLSLPKFHVVRR